MASEPGTLEQLATLLGSVIDPLRERVESGEILLLFAELGIAFPDALASNTNFANAVSNVATRAKELPELVAAIVEAATDEDYGALTQKSVRLIEVIRDLVVDFDTIADAIDANKGSFAGLSASEVEQFASALPGRLVDYLLVRRIEDALAPLAVGLDFIGVFQRERKNVGSTNPLKPEYVERHVNFAGITDFFKSPADVFKNLYDWGKPGFDGGALLPKLETLALELGLPAVYTDTGVPTLDLMFLELTPKTDINPPGLRLRAHTVLKNTQTFTVEEERWKLEFGTEVQAPVETSLILQPDAPPVLTPPSGTIQGEVFARFSTKSDPETGAFLLFGEANKSRLEFRNFGVEASIGLAWDPAHGTASGEFGIGGDILGGKLVIDLSGSDGFIGKLVPGGGFSADFEIGMGFTTAEGFYFRGSGALEIKLPLHLNLVLIELTALTLSAGISEDGIPIGLGADIKGNFGPLQAVVENIGLSATLGFVDGNQGNLGPVDVTLGFKPPNGVGLSLDAAVVKGGGYLFFDFDKEEYAGVLELAIAEIVTVKAIGLVTTRLPDGSKGFSLLIIITAEFGTGIQLGFGFVLVGLGGLLGVNRTMKLDALVEGVRSGSIQSVMFPHDVVANAPRIISDLKAFFPPQEGIFLIGPMAKLGWGTPALVTVSLGIVIEIPPGNIAILGVLKVVLPDEDAALLVLQVNFLGALEPEKDRLWFFASLYGSRVLFITLDGDMGLLIAWGDDANFVISVGGFHPSFTPPPLPFPNPNRIALSILNESWARIRVEGYFAVTSNTAQFGARVEVFFGFDACNVSGELAFDALFQFSPFYFIVSLSASLSISVFGIGLFSIRLRGQLEGTSPWHIEGEASIGFLFFEISVSVSHTWGEEEETTLPPIEVLPILEGELQKLENWRALLPTSNKLLVSLRKLDPTADLVLHPLGSLRVSQRALPLDLTLDKVGNQRPSDVNRASLSVAGGALTSTSTSESFAIAQFKDGSDSSKLSSPPYELEHAGVVLSSAGEELNSDRAVVRTVRYESIIIDTNFKRFVVRFFSWFGLLFTHFLGGNAASRSALSKRAARELVPIDQKVKVAAPSFVVATLSDNAALAADAEFTSHARASEYLRERVQHDPALSGEIHVIPATEAKRAA